MFGVAMVAIMTSCKSKGKLISLKSGIVYQVIKNGNGKITPKENDIIQMHIRAYVSDSMLFDSYKLNDNKPVPAQVMKPQFNGDIMELLALLKEGDSVVAKVPQDSIFRQGMKPEFVKAGDSVIYQIKMISVKSKADFEAEEKKKNEAKIKEEDATITKYIADNQLGTAQTAPGGTRVIITTPGSGENVPAGAKVKMNYVGMLMNGKKFDSNILPEFKHVQPFEFTLGKGMVIKGWDEGIAMMKKGSKGKLIIPSPLAYGANSPSPDIPADAILVFDVEVLDFTK